MLNSGVAALRSLGLMINENKTDWPTLSIMVSTLP